MPTAHLQPSLSSPTARSRGALALVLAGALAAAACQPGADTPRAARGAGGPRAEPDAISVRVRPAEERSLAELWSSSATLRPQRQATVTARTTGVVERLAVEEGDWVAEGQTLAVLEDDELRIALDKARILDEAKAAEHERALELHEKGLLADEAYDLKKREAREAANAAELARLNLSRTVIRAPFAGRVLERHVDVGATVANGTEVYDLADVDPLEADVNVPEPQVARMSPGRAVRLATDVAELEVEGRIVRIAPDVNPETGTVKVTVAAPATEGLRPGSFVRVEVVTAVHADACVVPRTALVAEGRRWHLFALREDGETVERLAVSPGLEEEGLVEVLGPEGGPSPLEPGRRVVVLGAPALSDGSRVRLAGDDETGAAPDGADGERT